MAGRPAVRPLRARRDAEGPRMGHRTARLVHTLPRPSSHSPPRSPQQAEFDHGGVVVGPARAFDGGSGAPVQSRSGAGRSCPRSGCVVIRLSPPRCIDLTVEGPHSATGVSMSGAGQRSPLTATCRRDQAGYRVRGSRRRMSGSRRPSTGRRGTEKTPLRQRLVRLEAVDGVEDPVRPAWWAGTPGFG
jgi:hypothetical protein